MAVAAPAAPAAVPGSATQYITPTNALAIPANLRQINAGQGGDTSLNTTTTNAVAPAYITPPASGPSADYNAQFVKSMAAARGAIAAGYAHQLAEVQAGVNGGVQMANAMPAQYNALGAASKADITQTDAKADKTATANGGSAGAAASEGNMINAADQSDAAFNAGQAPLLAAGVRATGAIQSNALAAAQTQANAQLDEQQASFDHDQAMAQQQEAYSTQQANTAWARSPDNPESPAYKAANGPAGTTAALQKSALQAKQAVLNTAGETAYTADQIPAIQSSSEYQSLASLADKGDPTAFTNAVWAYQNSHPGPQPVLHLLEDNGIMNKQGTLSPSKWAKAPGEGFGQEVSNTGTAFSNTGQAFKNAFGRL